MGKKGSGKTTFARAVSEQLQLSWGLRVTTVGFADALKVSVARSFGFDGTGDAAECRSQAIRWCDHAKDLQATVTVTAHDRSVRTSEIPFRLFLQRFGTEAHRDLFGEDIWVDQVLPCREGGAAPSYQDYDVVLMPDVRFPNEAQRILSLDGLLVRIVRPDRKQDDQHSSEQVLDVPSETICNDQGLDDLQKLAASFARTTILRSFSGVR